MTISAFQWYPTQINGHRFRGRNADFFQLPDTLLAVPAVLTADCGNLSRIQFTEFRTEHWFVTNDTTKALNGKVKKCRENYRIKLTCTFVLCGYKQQVAVLFQYKLVTADLSTLCLCLGILSQPPAQGVTTPTRWK